MAKPKKDINLEPTKIIEEKPSVKKTKKKEIKEVQIDEVVEKPDRKKKIEDLIKINQKEVVYEEFSKEAQIKELLEESKTIDDPVIEKQSNIVITDDDFIFKQYLEPKNIENIEKDIEIDTSNSRDISDNTPANIDNSNVNLVEENREQSIIKPLSDMAIKWKAYIEYQRQTPQEFLQKYPNHKFKEFIQEIIEYQVVTNQINM